MAAPSSAGDLSFLPRHLRKKLLPFQREGIKFALSRNGRCLIGDEMGLGKTLQAIAVAYNYQAEWPLLIVLPSALRYPWVEELEKWLPELQPNDVNMVASGTDIRNIPTCKISIVGYGLFRNDSSKTLVEALKKQRFQVVIVDESHYMKNAKTARTKLITPLVQDAKRAILLTGTPALGRPSELFSQINCIRPNMMGSWVQFSKRYCDAHWHHYGKTRKLWDTSGASNLDELHRKLKGSIMIRRAKKNVLTQLPPKRRQKVPFELAESAEKNEIDQCWLDMKELWKPQTENSEFNPKYHIHSLAGRMYTLTGKAKIGAVCEYVKLLLENQGLKFLVFAHHKEMMTALVQTVMAHKRERHNTKLKYIRIDGDVPSLERMHLVRQFQTDEDTRVAILSILAAGTGFTFTAASQVVFAELHWTPGVLEQCEDRAHRIGQINAIHVHYLVARGTMDEWIWKALSRKVSVLSSALNGKLQQLNMEEGGEEYADLLKHAVAWLPSNQDDEEDDSFYFTQRKDKNQDIRKFFTPSGAKKGKKRKKDKKDKATPTKTTAAKTSSRNTARLDDQPLIILDSNGEDVSEPAQMVVSAGDEDNNRRSSLEDFVDTTKHGPIRKKVLSDISEQNSTKVVNTQTHNNTTDKQDVGVGNIAQCPSGTVDDLPEMKSIIRRRSRKRKHISQEDNNISADSTPSNEVPEDTPSCSTEVEVKGYSLVTTPIRMRQDECTAHTSSSPSTEGESSNVERSPVCGKQPVVAVRNTTWSCSACTFENHYELPLCEICSTPRKNVSTRSHSKVLKQGDESDDLDMGSKVKPGSNTTSSGGNNGDSTGDIKTAVDHMPSTINDIMVLETPIPGESGNNVTDDASTHIDDTTTAASDSVTDSDATPLNDNDDIDEPESPVSIRDGSESPMSIGGDSDVILDPNSPCDVSDDLFSDLDDGQSPTDDFASNLDNSISNSPRNNSPNISSPNLYISKTPDSTLKGSSVFSGKREAQESRVKHKNEVSEISEKCVVPENKVENMNETSNTDDNNANQDDDTITTNQPNVIIKPTTICIKRKRKSRGSSSDDSKVSKLSKLTLPGVTHASSPTVCKEIKSLNAAATDMGVKSLINSDAFPGITQASSPNMCKEIKSLNNNATNVGVKSMTNSGVKSLHDSKVSKLSKPTLSDVTQASPGKCEDITSLNNNVTDKGVKSPINSGVKSLNDIKCKETKSLNNLNATDMGVKYRTNSGVKSLNDSKVSKLSKPTLSDVTQASPGKCEELKSVNNNATNVGVGSPINSGVNSLNDSKCDNSATDMGVNSPSISGAKSLHDSTTDIDDFSDSDDFEQLVQEMFDKEEHAGGIKSCSGDVDNPSKQEDHPISESESEEDDVPEPQVYEAFLFCCSKHTERIYLLDQDQSPLDIYFFPLDVSHHDLDSLPRVLNHPDNLRLVRRFVSEWYNGLTEVKRKQLRRSGYIFDSPVQAHIALKNRRPYEMCKKRFLTKEDLAKSALEKAKDVGGTVRIVSKPTAVNKKGHRPQQKQPPILGQSSVLGTKGTVGSPSVQKQPCISVEDPDPAKSVDGRGGTSGPSKSDHPGTSSMLASGGSASTHTGSDGDLFNPGNPVLNKKMAYLQVVDKDGRPLCLFCDNPTVSDPQSKHRGAAWDARFCSEQCKEEHRLRGKSTQFLREKLLEAEHGICQLCNLHAHDLFTQVRDLPKSQRKDFLTSSPYAALSAYKLNEIIKNPSSGQFWHADHIVAVYEGGGLCSLDNLRTLCVMCHRKVTNEQNRQRRNGRKLQQQREAGFGDITKFLKS